MNKITLIILLFPMLSHASDTDCANVGASIETGLFQDITRSMNIAPSSIIKDMTSVEVLNISPVSRIFAAQMAAVDHKADIARKDGLELSESQYLSSYYDNGVKNVTAKYTYQNKDGKKDIFIASGLINADECSVRYNGHLTLSREF
ncbi:Shiga toxin A subunit [Pseudescherichia sp.]|uniref:Shiga toxin A subunit n=1 Tax=Pseudescherichia sp. TaxID=2055881 RepID=UPI00289F7105|nr:Shiga toxin A subunit [Pseudescherichia sp.]